ncbi:HoxN/HupN/NixA family nickel/cobalt transporter [Paraburkholderia phenoliruptrix]|uniref:HoxN/HupN/NixA family nickel/cobalt transporter n=1 Tax=Paraburkholderia phenoliruptrix TaxID=252970 RepID=UPI0035A89CD0
MRQFIQRTASSVPRREVGGVRRDAILLYAALVAFNIAAWAWAWIAFHDRPMLMGTSLLAYSFGLRHAVDADHIAAIDNVTRKFMQAGQRPLTVGLYFSLGHSTVVILATVGIATTALALQTSLGAWKEVGSTIGTLVSTLFLLAIALINLLVLRSVFAAFRRVRRGESYSDDALNGLLVNQGLLARLFRPMFRLVSKTWHMYLVGFLFGLGFDTATEVGLLGISAASVTRDMSVWSILVFPALFTAGMTLLDTTDGILMLGAYGWAFVKPIRKLYYNITITFVSVVVALVVGSIEGLNLLAEKLHFEGDFWDGIGHLNENSGLVGYLVVAIFVTTWLVSLLIYRIKGYEKLEEERAQ